MESPDLKHKKQLWLGLYAEEVPPSIEVEMLRSPKWGPPTETTSMAPPTLQAMHEPGFESWEPKPVFKKIVTYLYVHIYIYTDIKPSFTWSA